jgi:peptidoglycan/LPS O-acetylase OafA/YrhL
MLKPFNEKKLFLLALLAAGLPIWFVSYHMYTKGMLTIISEVLVFLLATYASFQIKDKNKIIFFIVAGGFILAIILKIVIDILINPTDHNLWPFELILYMMAAFIFSGVGVGLGWGMKKLLNREDKID